MEIKEVYIGHFRGKKKYILDTTCWETKLKFRRNGVNADILQNLQSNYGIAYFTVIKLWGYSKGALWKSLKTQISEEEHIKLEPDLYGEITL